MNVKMKNLLTKASSGEELHNYNFLADSEWQGSKRTAFDYVTVSKYFKEVQVSSEIISIVSVLLTMFVHKTKICNRTF